jgi:hypothetical protein
VSEVVGAGRADPAAARIARRRAGMVAMILSDVQLQERIALVAEPHGGQAGVKLLVISSSVLLS